MPGVDAMLAQSVDDNNCCSDQETDEDGRDKKHDVSAHVTLLGASSGILGWHPGR
jgi:hypothetical protein